MNFLDIFKKKEPEEIKEEAIAPIPTELNDLSSLKVGDTRDENNDCYAGLYLPEEDRSTHLYCLLWAYI